MIQRRIGLTLDGWAGALEWASNVDLFQPNACLCSPHEAIANAIASDFRPRGKRPYIWWNRTHSDFRMRGINTVIYC